MVQDILQVSTSLRSPRLNQPASLSPGVGRFESSRRPEFSLLISVPLPLPTATGSFHRSLDRLEAAPGAGPAVILQRAGPAQPGVLSFHPPTVDMPGGRALAHLALSLPLGLQQGEPPAGDVLHGLGNVDHPAELCPEDVIPPGRLQDSCRPVSRHSAPVTVFQNLQLLLSQLGAELALKIIESFIVSPHRFFSCRGLNFKLEI